MKEFLIQYREIGREHSIVVLLLLLVLVEGLTLAFFTPGTLPVPKIAEKADEQSVLLKEPVLRISEINEPQIDLLAASITVDESSSTGAGAAALCSSLPVDVWVFLLFAYIALLVYNLSFTFKNVAAPQWFWETLYSALAILAWYIFDDCRANIWFPLTIIKTGLIIFVLYVYLLEKKKKIEKSATIL